MVTAERFRITGIVQGVGFRPFVYRLAHRFGLAGTVLNGEGGVEIVVEGEAGGIEGFAGALRDEAPAAARIAGIEREGVAATGRAGFAIIESERRDRPTTRISPDLPVCADCLRELFDGTDRRHGYPFINCTACGPRYSIVLSLPYDRPRTTMAAWPLCEDCAREYHDPLDRRFHAQPVACPRCGPDVVLEEGRTGATHGTVVAHGAVVARGAAAIADAARRLGEGAILAVKGIGGYHLGCDARNGAAVAALRERKYRKERPFALLARDLEVARAIVVLGPEDEALLASPAAPIVLAMARVDLGEVAPGTHDLGVMLPYTPLQHLLFAAGAPDLLVMTSANRSSEPIAYDDDEARRDLAGIADAFLVGERPIARRVDDSVVRVGPLGPTVLRRGRGLAPAALGSGWPAGPPILATGADLKNAVALVVEGQAFIGPHVGDLDHLSTRASFERACEDLCAMYDVRAGELTVAHDLHPDYVSTRHALALGGSPRAVQHHRAHIASVLAERGAWEREVIGFGWDGTGFGDDGSIWGGETFAGSIARGFERVGWLGPVDLPGGDAAAQFPPQSAAGFLAGFDALPDLAAPPFSLPPRFAAALSLARAGSRTHATTSCGRLFDALAALCGFTRAVTYEGQAAIWLEQLALRAGTGSDPGYAFAARDGVLDHAPLLAAVLDDRARGRAPEVIARGVHAALARALAAEAFRLREARGLSVVVLSGGVFQNGLLVELVVERLGASFEVLVNREVPPNDGGIALGQAALAAFAPR